MRKNNEIKGEEMSDKIKKDLRRSELDQKKINMQGKTIKELQQIAALHNLPIDIKTNNIQDGWVGKPKGIQQILWERGLLDPSITYMAKIKNNNDDEGSETRKIYGEVLAECHDFQNELTSLQHLAQTLGSMVDWSTKSHPELAGEDIKYSWGHAKCYYQSVKLKEKREKINLWTLWRPACRQQQTMEAALTSISFENSRKEPSNTFFPTTTWNMIVIIEMKIW